MNPAVEVALRRWARRTNLLIAGRSFTVTGSSRYAASLRRALADCGALLSENCDPLHTFDGDLPGSSPTPASPRRTAAQRIDAAASRMTVVNTLTAQLAASHDLAGLRIGICLVLEPKTAALALALASAGAEVSVYGHPEETDAEVAAELERRGVGVFGGVGAGEGSLDDFLEQRLQVLIDDGSRVIRRLLERPDLSGDLIGAAEETTSGLRALAGLELPFPVVAVNDARSKSCFDNAHGTGQSCLTTILDLLDPDEQGWLSGRRVAIAGFGPVGEGLARHVRALGGVVSVADPDPVAELRARFAGYETGELPVLAAEADLVVSASGYRDTIDLATLLAARPGAAIAVAGGVEDEVAWRSLAADGLSAAPGYPAAVERLQRPDGTWLLLLDRGGCINCTVGEGNPVEIMDLSFGVQLSALDLLLTTALAPGLHPVPAAADAAVSGAALQHLDVLGLDSTGATRGRPEPAITVYSADVVVPMTAPAITDGAVAVSGRRILHVGTRAWVMRTLADQEVTEVHWPGVLVPGLVNAHTHLQYTGMAAVGQQTYSGFEDWGAAFDEAYETWAHDWRASAAAGATISLASGVTSLADVVTDIEAATALHDAGLHGVSYWEVYGWANDRWRREGLERIEKALAGIPGPPAVGISPHAPYSLDTEPLLDLPDVARRRGARLHIHLGEQVSEGGAVAADESWRTIDQESFRSFRSNGFAASATDFVDQLGVLGPDCHIAHGIYLDSHDRSVLRTRGTGVALCPRSNAVIGLDEPPVAAYLFEGNLIGVGTDSLASTPSLDLLADVAALHEIAGRQGYRRPDLARRLLWAATLGGATALGQATGPERVGQLQVGALADLAFIDVTAPSAAEAIELTVRHGAGRVAATVLAGTLVATAASWEDRHE